MKRLASLIFILMLVSLFSGCDNKSVSLKMTSENYPRVDGSTATIPLAIALRSAVTGESEEDLQLKTVHSKTTQAFRSLQYGETDMLIVYTPNSIVLDELKNAGIDIIMEPIGRDALVLFTNEKNPVNDLSQKQTQDIYMGNITNWKDIGGEDSEILAYQRDVESGSQVLMEKLVMQENKMITPEKDFVITGMGEIIEKVASYEDEKNALGYSVYYYIRAFLDKDYKIKLINANGVAPSNETIKNGTYPYVQDFYAVIKTSEKEDSGARKLFNFLTSKEGKDLITGAGYVALD